MEAVVTAEEIVRRFTELGYRLEPDPPEAVLVHGRVRPPEELFHELRREKLAVIALLTAERTSAATESFEEHSERLQREVDARRRLGDRSEPDDRPRRLVAIEYDPATRLTTRFYSDGLRETPA